MIINLKISVACGILQNHGLHIFGNIIIYSNIPFMKFEDILNLECKLMKKKRMGIELELLDRM